MSYQLSPCPRLQFIDANGDPYALGWLYTYEAGSTTPLATYANSTGTPNSATLQLDAAGRATVYLRTDKHYKFVLYDVDLVPVFTQDDVFSDFVTLDGAETLSNKTLDDTNVITVKDSSFTIESAGDDTATVKFSAAGITTGAERTVTFQDSNMTLAGLETRNLFSNRQEWGQGANVTSANDITLGLGNYFAVTGTTRIDRILAANWQGGAIVVLGFQSAGLVVKHNVTSGGGYAGILLSGAADFTTMTWDRIVLMYDGSHWLELGRFPRFPFFAGSDASSTGDLDLGSGGNFIKITGTTTIEAVLIAGWIAGAVVKLRFASAACTVKHLGTGGAGTAQIKFRDAKNFISATNDIIELVYDGTYWLESGRATSDSDGTCVRRHETGKGANVASANNVTLGFDGNVFKITDATEIRTIEATGWQEGSEITLVFTAGPLVKHNTPSGVGTDTVLYLSAGVDFTASDKAVLTLVLIGNVWYEKCRSVDHA